jgi:hypothetical protein
MIKKNHLCKFLYHTNQLKKEEKSFQPDQRWA